MMNWLSFLIKDLDSKIFYGAFSGRGASLVFCQVRWHWIAWLEKISLYSLLSENRQCLSLTRLVIRRESEERVHESTGQSCYMPSHRFQWNFASLKGLPENSKRQTDFCFGFFRGEIDHPPVFLGFHQGNRFKIGKMYEALTAMVFNQLLWGFAHIFISLVDVRCKYQSIWLTACQSTEANIRLCF